MTLCRLSPAASRARVMNSLICFSGITTPSTNPIPLRLRRFGTTRSQELPTASGAAASGAATAETAEASTTAAEAASAPAASTAAVASTASATAAEDQEPEQDSAQRGD